MPDYSVNADTTLEEGDYTTWTKAGRVDLGVGGTGYVLGVNNTGDWAYIDGSSNVKLLDATPTLKTTEANSTTNFSSTYQAFNRLHTITGKYLIGVTDTVDTVSFKVFNMETWTKIFEKDMAGEVPLKTIDSCQAMAISPNGKYIIMWARESAGNNRYLILYVGS